MTKAKNFTKTVFYHPEDGFVPQSVKHTHTFNLVVIDDFVFLNVVIDGYMTDGIETEMIASSKKEIIEKFRAHETGKDVRGDIEELVNEFPDEFLRSMIHVML